MTEDYEREALKDHIYLEEFHAEEELEYQLWLKSRPATILAEDIQGNPITANEETFLIQ